MGCAPSVGRCNKLFFSAYLNPTELPRLTEFFGRATGARARYSKYTTQQKSHAIRHLNDDSITRFCFITIIHNFHGLAAQSAHVTTYSVEPQAAKRLKPWHDFSIRLSG